MAFFKKKTKSNQDSGRLPLVVAVDENEPKAIAFGVSWRAVASRSSTRADAIKIARGGGATHLLSSLQQFGYGLVLATAAPAGTKVFAAARVAARQHGGDAIYALKLFPDTNEYWFAVIRGGQPSSIDRVILSDNDMELIEAARQEIANGIEDNITYAIFTNLEGHDLGDKARSLTAQDLMLAATGEEDVLQALPKKSGQIPTPVIAVVGVAVLVAVVNKGWSMYQEKERQRLARLSQSAEEPPEQAWARATQAWADVHRAADPQGLAAVRVSLGSVQLVWGGWDLQTATCNAAAPVAPQPGMAAQGGRRWGCAATFARSQIGRLNREMKEDTPAGWTVQYRGLDTIVATWSLTQAAQPFKFEALRSVESHMVETVSRLQKLQPSFGQVGDLTFVPVEITPPRKGDGTSVPMVASVPQLRAATFTLKAPLRSIDALIDAGVEADWQQISMYFKRADGEKADLKSSALTADIKAVIYANANQRSAADLNLSKATSPMQSLRLRQVAALAVTAFAGLALTHVAHAADAPAALDKTPQTPAMRDSLVTVDSLITSENQQALSRAKEQSIAAGLTQPPPKVASPSGPPPGSITVASIYGIENDLRANITFNGEPYERVRAGARIGGCVITAINGRLVVLKAARKGVPAAACPTGTWTGIPSIPTGAQMADRVRAALNGMPSPAIPMPFNSVGAPTSPLQSGPRGPAPLKSNQPMVQFIPSGPVAPGQTSIPLIPRQLEPVQDERLQQPAETN